MLSLYLALLLPAHAGRPDRLASKARQSYLEVDLEKAFSRCSKALDIEPDHVEASAVCGAVLMQAGMLYSDPELLDAGTLLLEYVRSVDPTHDLVVSWDALLKMATTPQLLPEPQVRCTPAAQGAWDRAEEFYAQGDMDQAQEYYQKAAHSCEHPQLWTFYGDTFFHQEDYEGAIAAYDHALAIEPCYWVARRFKGDAFLKQGRTTDGIRWVASAIACNPTYEGAWAYLDSQIDPRVGSARSAQKPRFEAGSIQLALDAPAPWTPDIQLVYGAAFVPGLSRLAQERSAVQTVLQYVAEQQQQRDPGMELWQLLAEAQERGQTDEAILVLMLDEALVEEFLAYRDQNLDRLTDFVMALIR